MFISVHLCSVMTVHSTGGVLHEFIEQRKTTVEQKIFGDYYVISGRFGARSNNPQKYFQDAQVLEKKPSTHLKMKILRSLCVLYCTILS